RATTDVAGQVRFGPEQPAQSNEFVRAEAVVFNVITPMNVNPLRTLPWRADAIAPVVIISKTSSGPAQHRNAKLAQVVNCLLPVTVDIRDWRTLANPQPTVSARSQVLGELTVQLRANHAD